MNGVCDQANCGKPSTHGFGDKEYCRRDAARAMLSVKRCAYRQGPGKGTPCQQSAVDGETMCQPHIDYIAEQEPTPRGGAAEPRGGAIVPRGGALHPRGGVEDPPE